MTVQVYVFRSWSVSGPPRLTKRDSSTITSPVLVLYSRSSRKKLGTHRKSSTLRKPFNEVERLDVPEIVV